MSIHRKILKKSQFLLKLKVFILTPDRITGFSLFIKNLN